MSYCVTTEKAAASVSLPGSPSPSSYSVATATGERGLHVEASVHLQRLALELLVHRQQTVGVESCGGGRGEEGGGRGGGRNSRI